MAALLRYTVVGQRLDHHVADYPHLKKRFYRQTGLAWNPVDIETIEEAVGGIK